MTGRITISSMSAAMTTANATRASRRSYPNRLNEAVRETRGMVITYQDEICDARYSKACGGLTEDFDTAWYDKRVPYLGSISDASVPHQPIGTEEEASRWILSDPEAYCNTKDERLLEKILPDFDRETKRFFPLDDRIFPGGTGRDPARKIGF